MPTNRTKAKKARHNAFWSNRLRKSPLDSEGQGTRRSENGERGTSVLCCESEEGPIALLSERKDVTGGEVLSAAERVKES